MDRRGGCRLFYALRFPKTCYSKIASSATLSLYMRQFRKVQRKQLLKKKRTDTVLYVQPAPSSDRRIYTTDGQQYSGHPIYPTDTTTMKKQIDKIAERQLWSEFVKTLRGDKKEVNANTTHGSILLN